MQESVLSVTITLVLKMVIKDMVTVMSGCHIVCENCELF